MKRSFAFLPAVQKLRHEVKYLRRARRTPPWHSDRLITQQSEAQNPQRVVRIEPVLANMIENRANEHDADQSERCACSI